MGQLAHPALAFIDVIEFYFLKSPGDRKWK
jgi:hypothetical protein